MKNPFRLLEIEKSYILEMHRKYRDNFGTSLKEQLSSIKSENPQNVTYRYTHNGMTSTITFFSDGKYQSNRPLIANIRNLQGTWKYVPQTNGGGRIMYSSGGQKMMAALLAKRPAGAQNFAEQVRNNQQARLAALLGAQSNPNAIGGQQ